MHLRLSSLLLIFLFSFLCLAPNADARNVGRTESGPGTRVRRLAFPQVQDAGGVVGQSFPSRVSSYLDQHTSHFLPISVRNYLKDAFTNKYRDAWREFYGRDFAGFGRNKFTPKFPS